MGQTKGINYKRHKRIKNLDFNDDFKRSCSTEWKYNLSELHSFLGKNKRLNQH